MLDLNNKSFWRTYLKLLLLVTIIFVMLYSSFIFGKEMYGYTDVGADTTEQYLPTYVFETNVIKRGQDGQYNLQFGLGKYFGGLLREYLNPTDLPLLLFGEDYLHIGILAATYVRYALICLFALLFFRRLLQDCAVANICALLWTFSGYAILWGQHYGTLKAMVLFTVAIYGFQLFLDEDKKRFLVIPFMAYLAGNSYYRLYTACFFMLVYGIVYLALRGKSLLFIAKKAGQFVLVMLVVVCICAYYLLPSVVEFFSSPRTAALSTGGAEIPKLYSGLAILSFVSRVLSTNLIGTGNLFYGVYNYYETAILSVSILFVFADIYLLTSCKYWKQALCITIFCVLALCMPRVAWLLQFATNTQRWSYLLCFAEVIAVGFALKDILARRSEKWFSVIFWGRMLLADIILAGILYVFQKANNYMGGWYLNMEAYRLLVATIIVYNAVFLLVGVKKLFYPVLIVVVAAELVACNYATINNRETVSRENWYQEMYNDGAEAVVDWIYDQDDSLYRIGRTGSREYMAALMQDYNGLSCYNSTNSSEYANLIKSYGYTSPGSVVRVDGTDYFANVMLGVKYVIAESDGYFNPDYYEKIYDDGQFQVYENRYWLGFGYVYDQQTELMVSPYRNRMEKLYLLSGNYYLSDTVTVTDEAVKDAKVVDLLPYLTRTENCQVQQDNGLQVTGTADYMQLFFAMPEMEGEWVATGVKVTMIPTISSYITLHSKSSNYDWGECGDTSISYNPGEQVIYVENFSMDAPDELLLYCSHLMQDMTIQSVELILVNETVLQDHLQLMKDTGITELTQDGNTFCAAAENPYSNEAMLCVPLLYDTNWEARVDGQKVQIQNINGGLVGIEIPEGDHQIELAYRTDVYTCGSIISIVSIIGYVIALLVLKKRNKLY